jgi:TetR/AcrR family transcriptional regulator, transcriptional repressor for nem operon
MQKVMARTKEFNEDQVLDKAIEIFWYKGYNGTSAQDLVNYLGLSRSSLYDTFGDKQKLFVASLKKYQKQSQDQVVQIFEVSENIKESLHSIFKQAVIESLEDRITKGCFMVNTSIELAMHDPEISKIVQNNTQLMEDIFTKAMQKGQDLGQISKNMDAKTLARFIFNNYSGIRVLARTGEADKQVYDDIVKVILSVL